MEENKDVYTQGTINITTLLRGQRANLVARAHDPLWEESWGSGKSPKECREFTASITIGSSTLGKRAIFKLPNDGAKGVHRIGLEVSNPIIGKF